MNISMKTAWLFPEPSTPIILFIFFIRDRRRVSDGRCQHFFAGDAAGVVHCVLAFFFNSAVLALTINIAAGLI
jgi:hypothetical protein